MEKRMVLLMLVVFFIVANAFPSFSFAKEKELKLASWGSPKHFVAVQLTEWIKEVNETLAGEYKIIEYPGGQLYGPKDMHMAIAKGSVDMGVILQPAALGFIPMLQGVYLPFGIDNFEDIAKAYSGESLEIIDKAMQKKRIKLISVSYFSPIQIFCTKKNIQTVEDFSGMRILSQSPIVTEIFARLNAAPDASIPQTEHYMALKRGVSDATLTGCVGGFFNKTYEVAPFITKLNLSFATAIVAMNSRKFDKIPPEAQDVMINLGKKYSAITLQMAKGWDQKFTGEMGKLGVSITELGLEEKRKIKAIAQKSWDAWAKGNGPDARRLLELNMK